MSDTDANSHDVSDLLKGMVEKSYLRYSRSGKAELTIYGWLVYLNSPIILIQFGLPGSELSVARKTERPDIRDRFPETEGSLYAGFQVIVTLTDRSEALHDIYFSAILANGLTVAGALEIPQTYIKSSIDKYISHDKAINLSNKTKSRIVKNEEHSKNNQSSIQKKSNKTLLTPIKEKEENLYLYEIIKKSHDITSKSRLTSFLASGKELEFNTYSNPLVSIVLILHNKAEYTLDCLISLKMSGVEELEIVLIDNNSTDSTRELLDMVSGVKKIFNESNKHFVLSANQSINHVNSDTILFLNNDSTISPNSILYALETLSRPEAGAVGGRVIKLDGTLQEAGCAVLSNGGCYGYGVGEDPLDYKYLFRREVDFCSGTFLMTKKHLFEKLGGFDENFSPAYYEEVDYCLRLAKAGYKTYFDPRCTTFHVEHGSSSKDEAVKLQMKNQKYLALKHSETLSEFPSSEESIRSFGRIRPGLKHKILFLDDTLPFSEKGSGAPRTKLLLNMLAEYKNVDLTFYSMLVDSDVNWSKLQKHISLDMECMPESGIDGLADFLRIRHDFYDTIVISRPHNMEHWYRTLEKIRDIKINSKIIYDAESIFAEREIQKVKSQRSISLSREEEEYIISKELELAGCADMITVVSENDARIFKNHGYSNVEVISYGTDLDNKTNDFENRNDILFVGPLIQHDSPNLHGLSWFINKVLPILIEKYDFKNNLTVVGAYKENIISPLRISPHVHFKGTIRNLNDLYNSHRIGIAPIHFAAGIPLKVLDSSASGLPVVCTERLRQLLNWDKNEDILSVETVEEFAYACHMLYTEKKLWEIIRNNALKRIHQEYSMDSFKRSLQNLFNQ